MTTAAHNGLDLGELEGFVIIGGVVLAGVLVVYGAYKVSNFFGDKVLPSVSDAADVVASVYHKAVDATSEGIEGAVNLANRIAPYTPVGLAVRGVRAINNALTPTPLSPIEAGMKNYVGDLPYDDTPGFTSNIGGAAVGIIRRP